MAEFYFDTRDGTLLVGAAAIEPRLEEAGAAVVPLRDLLMEKEFPFTVRDFEKVPHKQWSRDELVQLGSWALNVMRKEGEQPPVLHREHYDRLYMLGLGPFRRQQKEAGTMPELRAAAGSPEVRDNGLYDHWTPDDFVAYAFNLSRQLRRRPLEADYNAAKGPGRRVIRDRIGGIGELNEMIGYPNVHAWEPHDYVAWGVQVMRANPHRNFNGTLIKELSKKDRGPTVFPIYKYFDSIPGFANLVKKEFALQEADEAEKAARLLKRFDEIESIFGSHLHASSRPEHDKILYISKFELAEQCLRNCEDKAKIAIGLARLPPNDFTQQLQKRSDNLDAAKIETEAVILGVYNIIWPPNELGELYRVA